MGQITDLATDTGTPMPMPMNGAAPIAPVMPAQPMVDPEAMRQQQEQAAKEEKRKADIEKKKNAVLAKYFANKPRAEIAKEVLSRVDAYYENMRITGRFSVLQRVYEYYYQGMIRQARLRKAGKEDEYTTIGVNHFRNIIQHIITKTTQQRPTPEPKAGNTDHKSMSQAIVASSILEHYNREKKMERNTDKAAEEAMVLTEAYVSAEWDAMAGEAYGETKMGDIDINNFNATTVAYDFTQTDPAQRDWIVTIRFRNKYDYAARYPELADRIAKVSTDVSRMKDRYLTVYDYADSDLIPVYRFYHRKTSAVPEGRFVEFLSSSVVTLEGPLPTKNINVFRIVPDEQQGSGKPYSIAFDLLPIQEAYDGICSTILTNQATFGVQNIAMPNGAGVGVESIMAGLNLVKYDPKAGKPEGMNLTSTPPEIFKFVDMLQQLMETISSINSVIRGQPEASIKSGSFAALIASQAIEFNSKYQKSYIQLLEDVYSGVIELLKENADKPRLITMAGKANRSYMRQFTKDDIVDITRVSVDVGNPIMRTTAGKLSVADSLLDRNMIKTPDEYIQLITTGRIEPMYEAEQAQLMLIRAENEKLGDEKEQVTQRPKNDPMTGMPMIDPMTQQPLMEDVSSVPAILTDDHMLHIKEHMVVLASPEARMNPNVVKNTLAHIREHMSLLMSGDPILALMGQPQLGGPPPAPSGGDAPTPSEAMDTTDRTKKKAAGVNPPNMPKNPQTGNKFNNQTGG